MSYGDEHLDDHTGVNANLPEDELTVDWALGNPSPGLDSFFDDNIFSLDDFESLSSSAGQHDNRDGHHDDFADQLLVPLGPLIQSDAASSVATDTSDGALGTSSMGFGPVATASHGALPAKIGTRFSKQSNQILRQWLQAHGDHPYPNPEELQILQYKTNLSITQIKNWLANSRRRNKLNARTRSTGVNPVDIPGRPGTPAVGANIYHMNMNPLERWVDSPPENEPATVHAIAHAVASTCAFPSGQTPFLNHPDRRLTC